MRPLIWFRSDLRVHDNPALSGATHEATRGAVAVFVVCPRQWAEHDWAPVRVDFVLRCVAALSERLDRLGIALRIVAVPRFEGVAPALCAVAREHGCDALFFNRELEVNEARRDRAVRRAFEADGLAVHAFDDATMLPPGSVLTNEGKWYTVYTPFRRRFVETYLERGGLRAEPAPRRQAARVGESDVVPQRPGAFDGLSRPDLWPGGEDAGLGRLESFLETGITRYHEQRDAPALSGTSTLSPYLTSGVVSVGECLRRAVEADGHEPEPRPNRKSGPQTWINELIWREFYRHLLVGFPRLCMGTSFRREYDAIRWSANSEHLAAWQEGRTGVPIVDAAMRQLAQSGWMHNRCRMIAAMFLTKNLLIDWREGERYFMRHLVDGDLASNNGGWQWSASTGTDAAPYFRVFNPASQSKTHDPDGTYIRRFVPELAELDGDAIHEPWTLPALLRAGIGYPDPIVDLKASRDRAIEAFREVARA
ncbi:MAG: deoxyribodipyrimidine photo-lyase [Phycisphaeraceae bacterium]|nr:deoxyribodipyrimidine photo-lyase [Phycisphaeraceae bacterium]